PTPPVRPPTTWAWATDTSGSAAYNMGLGERRANAVRDEMVRLGIPAGSISTQSFGQTRPAVDTGDGVREPLNRRSEVVIDVRDN
ncbi:OmpA family protein, partial [Glycocaulis profundi]